MRGIPTTKRLLSIQEVRQATPLSVLLEVHDLEAFALALQYRHLLDRWLLTQTFCLLNMFRIAESQLSYRPL